MMSPTLVGLHIAKVEVRGVTLVFTMETLVLRMRRAAAEPWLHITLYRAWWTGVVLTVLAVFVRYHTVDARCLATSNMRGTAELDFFVTQRTIRKTCFGLLTSTTETLYLWLFFPFVF